MQMGQENDCVELPFAECVATTYKACLFVWRGNAFTRWLPVSQVEDFFDDGTRDWRVGDTGIARVSRWLFDRAPELKIVATWDHPPAGWCAHCSVKLADTMTECGHCHDRITLAAERASKIVTLAREDGGHSACRSVVLDRAAPGWKFSGEMRKRGIVVKTSRQDAL